MRACVCVCVRVCVRVCAGVSTGEQGGPTKCIERERTHRKNVSNLLYLYTLLNIHVYTSIHVYTCIDSVCIIYMYMYILCCP